MAKITNHVRTYNYVTFAYGGCFEHIKKEMMNSILKTMNTITLKDGKTVSFLIDFDSDSVPFYKGYSANHSSFFTFEPSKCFVNNKNTECALEFDRAKKRMYLNSDFVVFRINKEAIIYSVQNLFVGGESKSVFSLYRGELKKSLDLINVSELTDKQERFLYFCSRLYKKFDDINVRKDFRNACNEFNSDVKTNRKLENLFIRASNFFEMVSIKYLLKQGKAEKMIKSAFLVVAPMNAATLCIESEIDTEIDLNIFLNKTIERVKEKAFSIFKTINTSFDSFVSFLRLINLNSFFNLSSQHCFGTITSDNKVKRLGVINTDIDLPAAKAILSFDDIKKASFLRTFRFFSNYLSAESAYYKEHNEQAIYKDVLFEMQTNMNFEPSFNNSFSNHRLVTNLLNDDTRNLFISNGTCIFSFCNPVQVLNGDDVSDLSKDNYYLAADFIDHKVRYRDRYVSFAILTHLIVIDIYLYSRLSLLCDSKTIDHKKMFYMRMPAIHNLNRKFSEVNRLFNPARMFFSQEFMNIALTINEKYKLDVQNTYLEDVVENYWQEANVTNGKYVPLIQLMLTVLAFSVSFACAPTLEVWKRILISLSISVAVVFLSFILLYFAGKSVNRKRLINPFGKNK